MPKRVAATTCVFLLLVSAAAGAAPLRTPEDRELSPYTGYTRAHWLEIAERLIAGFLPYFDRNDGLPALRNTPVLDEYFKLVARGEERTEAFDRSLVLVAIYTAATGKDRVPGYDGSITRPYLDGLIRGADPRSPHYWGPHRPFSPFGTDVALAILLSPRFFWDPLTDNQKRNVLAFLQELTTMVTYDCNHWYFHLMAVPVLEKYGKQFGITYNRERMTRIFERVLNWYRGDGWYIDGGNLTFDYYNLWGFQLYNNALCRFDAGWRERFGKRVAHVTREFQKSFVYLYGRDGGPVPWGRSLTYRFASLSALGYALLNGTNTLPPGQARRIASGCLKYFWEHGSQSPNGLLEAGYFRANPVVPELYIARGSPYWASHGLIALVLPEDHPFWTAVEEPMPADGAGGRVALPGAQMTIRVSPVDGEVRLYPVGEPVGHEGRWQRGVKYFQHAYSSFLGFAAAGAKGPDLGAGRTGVSYDGKRWQYRTNPRPIRVDPYHVVSDYPIRLGNVEKGFEEFGEVVTHTLIGDDGEVHVFWHTSARPAYLTVGGYSISVPEGQRLATRTDAHTLLIQGGENRSVIRFLHGPPGELEWELLEPRKGWHYSHIFGGRGAWPYWKSREPVPPNTPVAVYVNGTRNRPAIVPRIEVRSDPGRLRIRFEGVERTVRVPY